LVLSDLHKDRDPSPWASILETVFSGNLIFTCSKPWLLCQIGSLYAVRQIGSSLEVPKWRQVGSTLRRMPIDRVSEPFPGRIGKLARAAANQTKRGQWVYDPVDHSDAGIPACVL
jgi:hypothetical protein